MADNGAPDIGAVLNALMANPAAVSGIMNVLKNGGIIPDKPQEAEYTQKDVPVSPDPPRKECETRPDGGEPSRKPPHPGNAERQALLRALRPYLSEERCHTLDEILQFAGILDIFRKSGGK